MIHVLYTLWFSSSAKRITVPYTSILRLHLLTEYVNFERIDSYKRRTNEYSFRFWEKHLRQNMIIVSDSD